MKKSIFLFFAAILCSMTANAYNQAAKDLYFDNSEAKWSSCYVYIGHSTWTSCYPLSRVSGTQYLWQLPSNFNGGNSWGGASGWVLCYEKWWDSQGESIDKYTWHGDNNVTQKSTSAWVDTKIYKTNGTASTKSDNHKINAYKVTSYDKNNYTVTINTVEGGTLTVKDYDDNAVATGASKIHLTVLKFSATPASGYVLDGVQINDGSTTTTIAAANLATTTHTLTKAVTITPVWKATTSTVTVTATATNGTVTGGGVVEEGTSVTLTATPDAGYQFVNWTVGGSEVSTDNPYTFTAVEDVTVVANFEELPKTTVYFVNNKNWSKVNVYGWEGSKGENPGWPGADITANTTGEKIGEFDVYSYTVEVGSYTKIIFNDGSAQTANFLWTDGKYYYMGAATDYAGGTKEDVTTAVAPDPLATDVYLKGGWDDWAGTEFKKAAADATTATITLTLAAGKEYEFKVQRQGTWTSSKDNRDIKASVSGLVFSSSIGDNTKMTTTIAGDYVFTWDINQSQLSIAYPSIPVDAYNVTVPEGTIECYIKGAFDDWAEFHKMTKVDETHYTISIPGATTAHTYKYSSGASWDFEEVTADGGHVDSRTYNANDVVAKWKAVYDPDAVPQELVYNVTVPAGTTACYIAMDTDPAQEGWEFTAMTKVDDTHYTLTRTGLKSDAYKYACQPSWDYAEKTADGNDVANRVWAENDVVAKWATPPTYTIVGATAITGENWNLASTNNIMIKDGEAYTLTKTDLQLEAGDYEYKVAKNGAWGDGQYPAEGNQTVTIAENGVYTIVYTYTVGTSLTAEPTKTGDYTPEKPVYTVAGDAALCGSDWKADDTTNDMTDNGDGTFTWEKTDVKLTSNVGFKVVKNHDFGNGQYPAENWNINLVDYEGAAVYTVTITFTESSKEIAVTLTKTGEATPPVITYVLMGVNGDWDNGIALTQNPGNEDEYVLENQVIIKATDAVKVVTLTDGTATAWCGNVDTYSNATYTGGGNDNIVLEDGIYTFYFKKTANNIYINQTGYARNVTNKYGTICLPYASASTTGATFYRVAGKETGKVYLESVNALEAGVPYIFEKTANQIKVVYTGDKETTAGDANGLHGTFTDDTEVAVGNYILKDNALCQAATTCYVNANRAYLVMSEVPAGAPQQMPGRRYIGMDVQGENEATGVEDLFTTDAPVKVIENGQLIIIRDGVKYNVQGQKL